MNPLNPFQAFAGALPSFAQPILPGWTLNIDSNNSSSPRTEGLVVSRFSYGRQLGQVNDALAAIVALLPAEARALPAIDRFLRRKASIDVLKDDSLDDRVAALAEELRALQRTDPAGFEQASAPLRALLRASRSA